MDETYYRTRESKTWTTAEWAMEVHTWYNAASAFRAYGSIPPADGLSLFLAIINNITYVIYFSLRKLEVLEDELVGIRRQIDNLCRS